MIYCNYNHYNCAYQHVCLQENIVSLFWLVVSTILKNMKVDGKDDIPYMTWKIIQMYETTNQF